MSSSDSGIESENGHSGDPAIPQRVADIPDPEPVDLNMQPAEPPPQEQEKTLTDHLNKKLLESFLNRLDTGQMNLPPGAMTSPNETRDNWDDS